MKTVFPVTLVNTFKGKLDMVRRKKMGFFEIILDLTGSPGRISWTSTGYPPPGLAIPAK